MKFAFVASSVVAASAIDLATFDDASNWNALIDPVMGGQSTATVSVTDGVGILDGEVKIVPSLNAPGFITGQTDMKVDASGAAGGDLVLKVRTTTPDYAGFKVSFAASAINPTLACATGGSFALGRGCFKAPFAVPAGDDFTEIRIPLSDFSDKWSSATGELTTLCSDDSSVCPTADKLKNVQRVAIWGEGKAGQLHIEIDSVALEPSARLMDDKPNIVELAESVSDLSTLVAGVVAGDLVDTLSSPGPFTVFAPTNEAFGALPEGTLDSLMKPENKNQLVDILTYHVLPSQVLSTDLKTFQSVTTVEGKNVHVLKTHLGVHVGPSIRELKKVVGADNLASNGVAHIIDGVLIPPSDAMVV